MAQARPPSKLAAEMMQFQIRQLERQLRAIPPWQPRQEWLVQSKDRLLEAFQRRYPRA
jgi:hypothetical protein